jgi:hypothetical protein
MSTHSIAGNENFTLVENAAGVFQNLNVAYEQATELTVENITVGDENLAKEVVGLGTVYTVTGYAPVGFATTAAAAGVYLNTRPHNLPATSAAAPQLLHLPIGAEIIGMRLTNNGTAITSSGPANLSIANQAWSTAAPSGNSLAKETLCGVGTGVNSPAGVKFWPAAHVATATADFIYPDPVNPGDTQNVNVTVNLPRMTLGTAGEDQATAAAGVSVNAATREVGVLVSDTLTAGDLAVKLWYIAPTEFAGNRP